LIFLFNDFNTLRIPSSELLKLTVKHRNAAYGFPCKPFVPGFFSGFGAAVKEDEIGRGMAVNFITVTCNLL
jgi:hypothetical protein